MQWIKDLIKSIKNALIKPGDSNEQKIVDKILSLPKCYKTGGICKYNCKGLCKESC